MKPSLFKMPFAATAVTTITMINIAVYCYYHFFFLLLTFLFIASVNIAMLCVVCTYQDPSDSEILNGKVRIAVLAALTSVTVS